ncbi:MAG: CpXC domain-containing protein, partial [Acetatifactor sp.]|nr:CpXC domain-containing protein [Acetatifactor sp.]
MSNLHMMKNPWAVVKTTVQCQHCSKVYSAQKINCFDIRLWPEGREVLDQGEFFHPVCPQCGAQAEISYPSRYIDRELGIAAVLTPGIENQDTCLYTTNAQPPDGKG